MTINTPSCFIFRTTISIAYQFINRSLLRDRELQAATEGNKGMRTAAMMIHVVPGTLSVARVVGDQKYRFPQMNRNQTPS